MPGNVNTQCQPRGEDRAVEAVVATSLALAAVSLLTRIPLLGYDVGSFLRGFPGSLLGAYADLLLVVALTVASLGLLWLSPRRAWIRRGVVGVYRLLAVVAALMLLINQEAVPMLDGPVTWEWLYFGDFLRAPDVVVSTVSTVTVGLLLRWAAVLATGVALAALLVRPVATLRRRGLLGRLLLVGLVAFAVYYWAADRFVRREGWPAGKLRNPVVAFVRSALFERPVPLMTMDPAKLPVPFERPDETADPVPHAPVAKPDLPVRNVVLYVLESVSTHDLEPYGGRHPVTPTLERLRSSAIRFSSFYAHAPASNKAMVSLFLGVYPWPTYRLLTRENPGIALPSLPRELTRHGYRTGFFGAADLDYLGAREFLELQGFDEVLDGPDCTKDGSRGGGGDETLVERYLREETCTIDALIAWTATEPGRPFYAVAWTNSTHHPYFAPLPETDFGISTGSAWHDEFYRRYLNGLRVVDAHLERVVAALRASGLDRSTLVIVVGDHGEAFGQHGVYGHGTGVYEEHVHVPLMLIHPDIDGEVVSPSVGGLIDLPATTLDLLGFPAPPEWQGHSLFALPPGRPVFFFSHWRSRVYGFRDGPRKAIYEASDDHFELYDLEADPGETHDLFPGAAPGTADRISRRLAAWLQHQQRVLAAADSGQR